MRRKTWWNNKTLLSELIILENKATIHHVAVCNSGCTKQPLQDCLNPWSFPDI